jgi:hypothetical protein
MNEVGSTRRVVDGSLRCATRQYGWRTAMTGLLSDRCGRGGTHLVPAELRMHRVGPIFFLEAASGVKKYLTASKATRDRIHTCLWKCPTHASNAVTVDGRAARSV